MNATTLAPSAQAAPAFGPAQKLKLLLQREYWENRSFVWAPAITGIIATAFLLIGMIVATIFIQKAKSEGSFHNDFAIDGEPMGHGLGMLATGIFANSIFLTMLVMAFVVFFYALGALYDERRDRSVLFWKSLPISDAQVVLSKALWAVVLGPIAGIAVGVLLGIVLWLVVGLTLVVNGMPGIGGYFTGIRPFHALGQILGMLPVGILWSLPTVGWLMLCSAWSRRFPFLWAVLIPLLGCAMLSMTGLIFSAVSGADFPHGSLWYIVALRGLGSLIPGTWFVHAADATDLVHKAGGGMTSELNLLTSWQAFGSLDLWIGVAAGIAMIVLATRLRRWRDEG